MKFTPAARTRTTDVALGLGDVLQLEPLRPAELGDDDGFQGAAGSRAAGNISRSAVFRNLPTAVFGISSTNS